jgi:hypothetical protein
MTDSTPTSNAPNYEKITFNPGRVLRALARIGYRPESAICDIVDNSVSAGARSVSITLEVEPGMAENRRNNAARYIIADDGTGMDKEAMLDALGLGVERNYNQGSLGKFGMGLKSAGLSQGDRIEVVSCNDNGAWRKAVLDLPHIEASGSLECQFTEASEEDLARRKEILPDAATGTTVVIEKIHKKNHPSIRKTREALRQLLGVTYFYFLADTNPLRIFLDGEEIAPFDPLFVDAANENGDLDDRTWDGRSVRWLEEPREVALDASAGVVARIEATQLVHPPAFDNPAEIRRAYMIGQAHYGFYVYRNKRLIRWAERFGGIVPTDQDYFAFRGRILITDAADDALNIDVKKSEILLSEEAEGALSEAVYEARRKSKKGWNNAADLLRKTANQDPISKATEALSEVDFPDLLPTDSDDRRSQDVRTERKRKEAERHPMKLEEQDSARREGVRVILVDQLDDNALWERAYDSALGTIVRVNRSHRFTRLFYDYFGDNADAVLLVHALFLSLAVAESGTVRNLQDVDDDVVEEVFRRYRDQASAAVYKVTADALEQRFA